MDRNQNSRLYYQALINQSKSIAVENTQDGIGILQQIVNKKKSLEHTPQYDVDLDAELSGCIGQNLFDLVQNVNKKPNIYDKLKFANHMEQNNVLWSFQFPLEVPVISYLHIELEPPKPPAPQLKHRTPRKVINRRVEGTTLVPKNIIRNDGIKDENLEAQKIYEFLKNRCPNSTCSYFKLVLDPREFSRTVENMFHVAHLVFSNEIAMFIDKESGLPYVKCLPKNKTTHASVRNSVPVSMDIDRWANLIEHFHITEPFFDDTEFMDTVEADDESDSDSDDCKFTTDRDVEMYCIEGDVVVIDD